jgi:glycosyltransferase involved in cell wall biosynthesis
MKPLVSILIPAYNSEEWISDTIRSAMGQTWERKEIIVVDDGSKDQTFEMARRFESELVRVVQQENQGAAAARNKALSLSRGDYIQWLDADDLLAPDKIAQQMEAVGETGDRRTLLSSAWGQFMYRPDRAQFRPSPLWSDLSPAEFLIHKLGQRVFMQTAVWLVSRELTEAAGPWNTQMISDDDGEYFCRVLLACRGVRFVPKARVYYRAVGAMSLSYVGRSDRKLEALWDSMVLHIRYLRSLEDSERTRAACLQFLQNYLIAFHPLRPDLVEQMYQAAKELGGELSVPRLPWKYSWIKGVAGWNSAKRAQLILPEMKWRLIRWWDKAMFKIERPKLSSEAKGEKGLLVPL